MTGRFVVGIAVLGLAAVSCSSSSMSSPSAPTTSAVRTSTTPTPTPTTSAPPALCRASQLTGRGGREGEEGGAHGDIEITNTTATDCSLDIRGARMSLVGTAGTLALEQQPAGSGRGMHPQVVPSKAAIGVVVFWSNWCRSDPGPLRAVVDIPASRGTVTIPFDGPPDSSYVPRCDVPTSPSETSVLGFAPT